MSTQQEQNSTQQQIDSANKAGVFLDHADASGRVSHADIQRFIQHLSADFRKPE